MADQPVPAMALRAQVPARYLRLLSDWADQVAQFQCSIGNGPVADKASWMCAVLNPEWEEGVCGGLTGDEAERGCWADCGSRHPHGPHVQTDEEAGRG